MYCTLQGKLLSFRLPFQRGKLLKEEFVLLSQRVDSFLEGFNPIALRTAKTLWSFGCSECDRVSMDVTIVVSLSTKWQSSHTLKVKFSKNHISEKTCLNVRSGYTFVQSFCGSFIFSVELFWILSVFIVLLK